jgi:hypothetical protein
MLFGELAEVVGGWLWRNDMIGNKLELGLGCFGRLAVEKAKGRVESIGGWGGAQCMVWLTSLGVDCYRGCLESCFIFLLDSRNMGQSFVQWLVSLPWYMQYRRLNMYGPRL